MKRPQKLSGIKILVVDDEPDLREVISSRLQMEGSLVTVTENGDSALKILKESVFDAIISDIRMPGGSGIELLEGVRAMNSATKRAIKSALNNNAPTRGMPLFILITGFSDLSRKDALARGATALLVKPFDLDDMITAVSDAFKNKEQL